MYNVAHLYHTFRRSASAVMKFSNDKRQDRRYNALNYPSPTHSAITNVRAEYGTILRRRFNVTDQTELKTSAGKTISTSF